MDEACNKTNKPQDCINCSLRESLRANTYSVEIECKYGKSHYQTNSNFLIYNYLEKGK